MNSDLEALPNSHVNNSSPDLEKIEDRVRTDPNDDDEYIAFLKTE